MRCLVLALVVITGGLTPPARLAAQPPDLLAPTDALSPADERKAFTVPAGFDVQLVAAEPDINKPMQMAFDAKGRLWVATSRHYPFPADPGKGTDKLYVLSDFGDDGKAKKITLFADNLNIPIGVMPLPTCDGCIVSNIGTTCEIVKLTDTDGDGKADKAETLFSGFGTRDTHGMVNSFTLMPDGWVYACHGYANNSKVRGKDGHEIDIHSGNVLRFRLDGSRIEVFTRGQVNPFGLAVDPWFNIYTADCHSKPMTANIPGSYYESFGKPHDGLGYGPNMIGYDPGGTGMCGLAWYDAGYFPKNHLGMMYLGNVITNRVNAAKIEWTGATPNAVQQQDLIASSDRWFRPVDIKLGPDGAIYVSDFYNKIIGHYEMPLKDPRRDRDRGRIWRVVKKDAPPKMPFTDLTKETPDELLKRLANPNFTVRLMATNELIGRGKWWDKEAPKLATAQPKDQLSLHALAHLTWISTKLDLPAIPLAGMLTGKKEFFDPFVCSHQIRAFSAFGKLTKGGGEEALNGTAHELRAVAEFFAAHPHADNIKPLVELIPKIQAGDTHLRHAARIALRNSLRADGGMKVAGELADTTSVASGVLADVMLGLPTEAAAEFLAGVVGRDPKPAYVEHAARYGSSTTRPALAGLIRRAKLADRAPLLGAYFRGLQSGNNRLDAAAVKLLPRVGDEWAGADAGTARAYVEAIALLPSVSNPRETGVEHAALELVGVANAKALPTDARGAAMDAVSRIDPQRALPVLIGILNGTEATAVKERAVVALANVPDRRARSEVNVALKDVPYRVAVAAAVNMASTPAGGLELFAGVKAGFMPARVLQDKLVLERLKASKVTEWEKRVGELTRNLPPADARLAELIKQRGASFTKLKGDKAEGAKLFTKHCAACHAIASVGGKIAPQLDGVGLRGIERVLEDVLDPNRNVDVAFRARVLNLTDGTTKTGLMIKVDGEVLVMADDQGKEFRVPRKDIESNRETALSPMPANFGDIIPEADFAHLLAYLLDQKVKDAPKEEPKNADGFESVFNGKDFTGWQGAIENYEVLDGAIVCKPKKGGNIYTTAVYDDFVVRLEYKLPPGGNNGLAIRYPGAGKHAATEGMCEVQILDDTDAKYKNLDPRQFNGSAYGMAAAKRGHLRPVGEWNVMEVTAKGSALRVELNGTRVLDADVSTITDFKDKQAHPGKDNPSGHFGFCGHNDPVAFRNIQIKKLK